MDIPKKRKRLTCWQDRLFIPRLLPSSLVIRHSQVCLGRLLGLLVRSAVRVLVAGRVEQRSSGGIGEAGRRVTVEVRAATQRTLRTETRRFKFADGHHTHTLTHSLTLSLAHSLTHTLDDNM